MALASDLASMVGQVKSRNLGNALANLSMVWLRIEISRVSSLEHIGKNLNLLVNSKEAETVRSDLIRT